MILPLLFSFVSCADSESSAKKVATMSVQELLKKTEENMVKIKGGTFMMGDVGGVYEGEEYERATWPTQDDKVHEVTLSDFAMGKYEVTLAEYDVYSETEGKPYIYENMIETPKKRGVLEFARAQSWQDAKDYCLWLGKQSGKKYDLPTEAQWEFTARNRGKKVLFGTDDGTLRKGENYDEKRNIPGRFKPNPLGIYDLTSNTAEWVNDWYSVDYDTETSINPKGPKTGTKKVIKGNIGSVVDSINYSRAGIEPDASALGFRCVENF